MVRSPAHCSPAASNLSAAINPAEHVQSMQVCKALPLVPGYALFRSSALASMLALQQTLPGSLSRIRRRIQSTLLKRYAISVRLQQPHRWLLSVLRVPQDLPLPPSLEFKPPAMACLAQICLHPWNHPAASPMGRGAILSAHHALLIRRP